MTTVSGNSGFLKNAMRKADPFNGKYQEVRLDWYKASRRDVMEDKRVLVVLNSENLQLLLPVAEGLLRRAHSVSLFLTENIDLPASLAIPVERVNPADLAKLAGSAAQKRSYVVYQYLEGSYASFDVVLSSGPDAYYSMLARNERISFPNTAFFYAATSQDPQTLDAGDAQALGDLYELRFMDIKQLALADRVFSFTQSIICPYVNTEKAFAISQKAEDWNSFIGTFKVPELSNNMQGFQPLVSICIVHFNRPTLLLQALDSIASQTYQNIQVIIVDNQSTLPEVSEFLEQVEKQSPTNWKIIRSSKISVPKAKNLAASNADGDFVLFLDDDNYLKPEAIYNYLTAVQNTGADIVSASHEVFAGKEAPVIPIRTVLYLGASPVVGLVRNCFGDANFFINREVFNSIKFTDDETQEVAHEDHEFYVLASLAGYQIELIPQSLLWNRQHSSEQLSFITPPLLNNLRALRPYAEVLGLADIIKFLATLENMNPGQNNCTSLQTTCEDSCCSFATHYCDQTEHICKENPFLCPATGTHMYCKDVGRCVVIGGIDGISDCGECGRTCKSNQICARLDSGWQCVVEKEITAEEILYHAPTVHNNEDGSIYVDTPEVSLGYMVQGEEKAIPAPDYAGFRDLLVLDDEVVEYESSICLNNLHAGDKFRVSAIPHKKAIKAASIHSADLSKESSCVHLSSALPVKSLAIQRVGAPRRIEGRSIPTLKIHQTARAVRTAQLVSALQSSEQNLSAASTQTDTPTNRVPVVTIINFNFAGTLPRSVCFNTTQ